MFLKVAFELDQKLLLLLENQNRTIAQNTTPTYNGVGNLLPEKLIGWYII